MPTAAEIKELLEPLFHDEDLRLVLLFGSLATGTMHRRSDIDVAFLYDKPRDLQTLTTGVIRLLKNDNIDVVDLRRASPLLKFSAIRQGKILYERAPGIFDEFSSLAFRMFIDTKKLREAQAQSMRMFLKERGLQ